MSSWILPQLREGLNANVSGEHVTCLNNGVYVKQMSRSISRELNDRTFTAFAFALTVRSLCFFISHRASVEGIIKKTWQLSEKVEYNAVKVLPVKANN